VSSHNVEVVRRIYSRGAWDSEGDPRLALDFIDPEFEFVNPVDAVVPGTRRGHEGFCLAMQSAVDALEHFSHEPIRFTDAGEKVIVEIMLHARGRMSGLSLSRPEWHVWTVRNGKAVRVEWFKQEEAAQRFAGLTDPPNSS
jgi:ketosteroid isomerase-like protein